MTQLEFPFMSGERLLAIDPDTKVYGWAYFVDGILRATEAAPLMGGLPHLPLDTTIVCEIPENRSGSSARKNDIIKLAFAAGRIVGNRPCIVRTPSDWKGQLPKKVHWERMREALSRQELTVLDAALADTKKGSHPEILDAVALGLTQLGRL